VLLARHSAKPKSPLLQRGDDDDLEDSLTSRVPSTSLEAARTALHVFSSRPIPKGVMSITHSYNDQGPRSFHNPANGSRRPVVVDENDSVDMPFANTEESRSSPVPAATAFTPQKRNHRTCAEAPYLARVKEHGLPEYSGTVLGD